MKITANRRDDVIKQRDKYEADYQAKSDRYEAQRKQLNMAQYEVLHGVEERVAAELADISEGADLEITAQREWNYKSDDTLIGVRVQCHDRSKFDEGTALAWNWSVKLNDDGEVVRDSGSWSGLKACTVEQLDDLQRSLSIMRRLNDMDWGTILRTSLPQYQDYVTEPMPTKGDRPNFEQMLFDIDIEEAIGKPVLIKGTADWSRMYFAIIGQSDKQYKVVRIPEYALTDPSERNGKSITDYIESLTPFAMRVLKSKFATMVETPIKYWEG